MYAGERGDDQRGPLRTEISVRAIVVPLAERVRAFRVATAADSHCGNAQTDRNVRVGARRARRRRKAERFRGSERGLDDWSVVGLRAGRTNADRVDVQRQLRACGT